MIAIDEVFLNSDKRFCCRLIYVNFKQMFLRAILKNLFWQAARNGSTPQFLKHMEEIMKISPTANKWLSEIPFGNWSMFHFTTQVKLAHVTNNE